MILPHYSSKHDIRSRYFKSLWNCYIEVLLYDQIDVAIASEMNPGVEEINPYTIKSWSNPNMIPYLRCILENNSDLVLRDRV